MRKKAQKKKCLMILNEKIQERCLFFLIVDGRQKNICIKAQKKECVS